MSLKHAILVLLDSKPGSGYDLMGRFSSGIGHFWRATHQQVYQELKKLHDEALVEYEVETQAERPDKKNYRITRAGRKALAAWMAEPLDPLQVRDALLVKIYGGHLAKDADLLAQLDQHIVFYEKALAEYGAMEAQYFEQDAAGKQRHRLPYLTLRRGIRYVQGSLDWLREARELIEDEAVPKKPLLSSAKHKK